MQNKSKSLIKEIIINLPEIDGNARQGSDKNKPEAGGLNDHQHSAIYAASHVHSAVHHVKPHHSTRIEL